MIRELKPRDIRNANCEIGVPLHRVILYWDLGHINGCELRRNIIDIILETLARLVGSLHFVLQTLNLCLPFAIPRIAICQFRLKLLNRAGKLPLLGPQHRIDSLLLFNSTCPGLQIGRDCALRSIPACLFYLRLQGGYSHGLLVLSRSQLRQLRLHGGECSRRRILGSRERLRIFLSQCCHFCFDLAQRFLKYGRLTRCGAPR